MKRRRLALAVVGVCAVALAGALGACGKKGDLDPLPSATADRPEPDEDRVHQDLAMDRVRRSR